MSMDLNRRLRYLIGPLVGIGAMAYFSYHTVEGDRGVLSYMRLQAKIADAEGQLARVSGERQALEHRVLLLRPDHLDPDLLEERARIMLNMGREGELVIFDRRPQ